MSEAYIGRCFFIYMVIVVIPKYALPEMAGGHYEGNIFGIHQPN